ncbi:MAG: stage V sporulation protein AA [Bacillus sp. (in: firmicutes)]
MEIVYLRLRNRVKVRGRKDIKVGDIAKLIGPEELVDHLKGIHLRTISKSDRNLVIFDLIQVIERIVAAYPQVEIQGVGPDQTLLEVEMKKKKINTFYFGAVWLLLFVGSAVTIMNFHEDVSMRPVQIKLYKIITGEYSSHPYILQIPYSIGLGLGMVLFFNHFFKKRFNEEPSPLEVEMFNYQQDLDRYAGVNENEESVKQIDDDMENH